MMIPPDEVEELTRISLEATVLAHRGERVAGYDLLAAGLRRARALQSEDCPWSTLLASRWELMLAGYCERFGPQGVPRPVSDIRAWRNHR